MSNRLGIHNGAQDRAQDRAEGRTQEGTNMATQTYNFSVESATPNRMNRDRLAEHLEELENFLFDPVGRRNIAVVSNLLAEEFREFGSSGRIYTKLDILAELSVEQPVVITLTDFLCQLVSPTTALVTYKSLSSHDNRPPTQALRSSLWVLRESSGQFARDSAQEEKWQMLFHQGTRF